MYEKCYIFEKSMILKFVKVKLRAEIFNNIFAVPLNFNIFETFNIKVYL